MIFNVKVICIVMLAYIYVPFVTAAAVPIVNSGFEDKFTGWKDTDPSSISGDSYNGAKSAKITGSRGRVEQMVSLKENTDYMLTVYVRGKGEVGINLGASINTKKIDNTKKWEKVTIVFNSGSSASGQVFAKYYKGEGRFDDFTLEETNLDTSPSDNGNASSVPGRIQAEDYVAFLDTTPANLGRKYRTDAVDIQSTTDINGGYNVGWIDTNEWLEYPINVTQSGVYTAEVRIASAPGNGMFHFELNGVPQGNAVVVDATGGWQRWTTLVVQLGQLSKGSNTLRLQVIAGGFNVNWIALSRDSKPAATPTPVPTVQPTQKPTQIPTQIPTQEPVPEPTSAPVPNTGLDPNKAPSENFDLSAWYLGVPIDNNGDGKSDSIRVKDLNAGYQSKPYFYTGADGGLVFKSTVSGPKTSKNTKYTRSELREMLTRGKNNSAKNPKNNWVFSTAPSSAKRKAGGVDGVLRATLSVNHVTTTGKASQVGRVIIGQIHAKKDEPLRLYYRKLPGNKKGVIYFAHEIRKGRDKYVEMIGSRKDNAANPSDGIALNEVFTYDIDVRGNTLKVSIMRPGKMTIVRTFDMSDSGYAISSEHMYFKAGVYNQNNSGDASDYVQATFYSIQSMHSGI